VVCPRVAPAAVNHEENVSAEQSASEADTRVSRAYGDARRAKRAEAATREGPETPDGLGSAEAARVNEGRAASFPKRARLRKRNDYLRVQRDGRRHHTEHFVVLFAPAALSMTRMGITVSSRVGNAVVRNRLKRMVREVLRATWRVVDPPADVVVIAKPGAADTVHAQAASELRRALGLVAS